MANVLIVDDEENLSYSVQLGLRRAGHECRVADTVQSALAACEQKAPDLAVIDIQLPDGNGIELMSRLREQGLDIPVIVITAFGTVASAVQAMKQGAVDYIQKPISIEEVCLTIERCLEHLRIRSRLEAYQEAQRRESGELEIVGQCPRMREVIALAERVASVESEPGVGLTAILLLGETGTGKDLLARHIHHHGPRPDRPFVQVNCSAIPENLFEAELFGYERGAFTDAKKSKSGLFETAREGTLFLDEIGDIPTSTQAKLLTTIESGRLRRLGATAERLVDLRVIAATNTDLGRRVQTGAFRADLYYRLKVFCIELPPLRERGDDILLLAEYFIRRFSRKFHRPTPTLAPETIDLIRRYPWPGNVRELANVLQRAVLVSEDDVLRPGILGIEPASQAAPVPAGELRFDFTSGSCTLASVERRLLEAAMEHTRGNVSEAARLLGISRGSLRHRLERCGLQAGRYPEA